MGRPTLIDVAREANVSRATAARVLAGATNVDLRMSTAVQQAARTLGYETNQAARTLRTGRAGAIGLVVAVNELGSSAGSFVGAILKGVTQALTEGEVQPVLLPADVEHADRISQYLRTGPVDGVIVILQHEITHIAELLAHSSVPLAWVGRPQGDVSALSVSVDCDNYEGGRMAATALHEAGRRELAIIAGPDDMEAAVERRHGWNDRLVELGLEPGSLVFGDFTMNGGAAAMSRLLNGRPNLDGVFASSDLMAAGAIRVLQATGRAVPAAVSVVGFDDVFIAATSEPPITTVRQPLEDMGRVAAEQLLKLVAGEPVPQRIVLPTALVRRESV